MRSVGDIFYNFHWVIPGEAARAAQAWAGGVGPFLEKRGIAAVINLRGRNDDLSWWQNETREAEARGIAHLEAALALHEGANRPKTTLCPLHGQGFMKNKMGAHLEATLESDIIFDQNDGESSLIDRCGLNRAQNIAGIFAVGAIDDDRFEALPGDAPDGGVRPGAMLDADFEVTEHPAQNAHGFFVRTQ